MSASFLQKELGSQRAHHHELEVRRIKMLRLVKEAVKKVALDLTAEKKLAQPDDVWYLRWPELLEVAEGKRPNVSELIAQRQAVLVQYAHIMPSVILTSDGESPAVKYQVEDAPAGALIGNPVSSGTVEGIARVIHDPHNEANASPNFYSSDVQKHRGRATCHPPA